MDLQAVGWLIVVTIPLLVIVGIALFHVLARRPDLAVASKAGWIAVIVLIPYIGVLIYALFRPPSTAPGKEATDRGEETGTMRRVRGLVDDHARGVIDDEQFASAKRELFGL